MNKVKDGNFYVVQSWMVKDLHLKGNDKDIYAIIFGFSQDGESAFTGSLQYLADWTNSTKQGVMKSLKNLLEKKLIFKKETYKNNIKFVEYYATKFNGSMQQSLINNKDDNINNNIEDNIENKNIKKETIFSEKEILFEEFYKLYQSYVDQKEIEITDKTRATEHYLEKKKKFIQNSKHYTAEEIINGTKDYLAYVDFERKSWAYPYKTMIAFINKKRWVGNDDGTPWIDVLENKRNLQKNVFINKITAPNAHEIKKQIKQQERFLLPDDNMPF